MVYFTGIRKTEHYIQEHEKEVPWAEVIKVIFASSKSIRKKKGKLGIENKNYYILCSLENNVLYVINAKRK